MTDDEIKEYIDKLNTDDGSTEGIFLRQLNQYVYLARVWEKKPELDDEVSVNTSSYRFFFIKDLGGKYVGAVVDMRRDLHWYLLYEERKKGHLTKALREVIIPFLFYDDYWEREVQRITINPGIGKANYLDSKKVAERLGFKSVDQRETIFELNQDEFNWKYENLQEQNGKISEERLVQIKKQIVLISKKLMVISDELRMAYNDEGNLGELAIKIGDMKYRIEDLELNSRK